MLLSNWNCREALSLAPHRRAPDDAIVFELACQGCREEYALDGLWRVAACKLDPTISSVGVDIDVDAVHIANINANINANAEINGVNMVNYLSNLVQTKDGESRSRLLLKAYSSKQGMLAEVLPDDKNAPIYDAVVANIYILAAPLVMLASTRPWQNCSVPAEIWD
jgi:hypothetical protein